MCGIIGYVGERQAPEVLIHGLRKLEYRGYDSAGVATNERGRLEVRKCAGRVDDLARMLAQSPLRGTTGIGHTRWATHGPASDANAHPHFGGNRQIVLAHNGVIENYANLKEALLAEGYVFHSQTDTEVIGHLIASCLDKQLRARGGKPGTGYDLGVLLAAVEQALAQLKGTYGLAILSAQHPGVLIGARLGSPLVVGAGDGEHFLASDSGPLVGYAKEVVYLGDNELVVLTADDMDLRQRGLAADGWSSIVPTLQSLDWSPDDADRGRYDHYMLKEIFEQPETVQNAMRGRLDDDAASAHFGGLNLDNLQLRNVERIILTACGTSYHAALVGEYLIEELARIPVEVEYASEFRYRNPPIDRNTILFAITQSGETADTLAALRESKRKGHATLAICNVVGSTIAREADGGIYLHAGPEIGVASTKAFTAQVTVLALLALYLGRMRHLSYPAGKRIIDELRRLPDQVRCTLETNGAVREIAEKYYGANNFLYLGRHYNYPVALEGALKLKEISYIHAEGYPAAEMKHGPIALVDEQTPSVFLITRGIVYEKVMSNLEEIKARGGPVIAIATEGDDEVARRADDVIYVPEIEDYLQPVVAAIPLQLLAYHIAVLRRCDVDKPRNLAKSVTVE